MAPTTFAPIFIVGVPRSGTTLLAAMLNAHPRIAISPETFFLEWALRRAPADLSVARTFDDFWGAYTESDAFAALGLDEEALGRSFRDSARDSFGALFALILESYAAAQGKPRGGEKTPRHYLYVDTILEWFPQSRVVFVVRDPRAVAASLLLVPWASDDVEEHARRWQRSTELLQRFGKDRRVLAARYEDLVARPQVELERLCTHIDEPFDHSMLEFAAGATALVADEAHKRNVLRPLSPDSLTKWKNQLSPRQTATIEHIAAVGMAAHGYEREAAGLGPGDRAAIQARRVASFAERAMRRVRGAVGPGRR